MEGLIYSVEDDKDIAKIINVTLSKQGYEVKSFYDGKSLFDALDEKTPDMILLDMMLPDLDGLDILKRIRSNSKYEDTFIIIISARRMVIDKVDGFDYGADDYIEKPFDILELMSRVNSKFRRIKKSNSVTYGKFRINKEYHQAYYSDNLLDLTVKEFEILSILVSKSGKVVTREEILNNIWGENEDLQTRTIDMHIKSLRKKIGVDDIIETVYGVGYKVIQ
ncbi:MAG: response regulator transcription factor [Acholeplasmatales bacterium]|nr:response regulator transcription factor [Acholeplasmatales bacterium]